MRRLLLLALTLLIVVAHGTFLIGIGYEIGYLGPTAEGVGPPKDIMVKTTEEATQVVEEAVKDSVYGVGYNCVDFTLDAIRALRWDGQLGVPAAIIFEDGTSHEITCTATTSGWIFLESQTGAEVHPVPGGYFMGKKIEFVKIGARHWFDFSSWELNPVFEIVE